VSDLVLENERLVDETRNPWFVGDVGIEDNMIVELGRVGRISHRLGQPLRSGREASPSTLRHLPARPRQDLSCSRQQDESRRIWRTYGD